MGYFSSVCPRQLFFFKYATFPSIHRVFEPFQCPRTILSSISGIKTSRRAINIDYPLHRKINNLIVFDYFTTEKRPNSGNWAYDFLINIGLLWRRLLQHKSQFDTVWCSEPLKFLQHCWGEHLIKMMMVFVFILVYVCTKPLKWTSGENDHPKNGRGQHIGPLLTIACFSKGLIHKSCFCLFCLYKSYWNHSKNFCCLLKPDFC